MVKSRIATLAAAAATVVSATALFGERQPFDRYQSVVDRQMFGQPPPGFDPTKAPSEVSAKDERAKEQELTKEQEQVKSAIHFSVINVTPAGATAVGFTDNSEPKNPKHYYLKVGESRDGWTVKEADPLAATMTIAKGEVEVSLTIGGNSANGGAGAKGAAAKQSPAAFGARPNLLGGRMGGTAGSASRGFGSLRERRAMREQQKAAAAQAAAEKERKAAEEREKEREKERAQREAEREAEKAEREKEREETQKRLAEMAEEIKRQREAAKELEAKGNEKSPGGDDAVNKEKD